MKLDPSTRSQSQGTPAIVARRRTDQHTQTVRATDRERGKGLGEYEPGGQPGDGEDPHGVVRHPRENERLTAFVCPVLCLDEDGQSGTVDEIKLGAVDNDAHRVGPLGVPKSVSS